MNLPALWLRLDVIPHAQPESRSHFTFSLLQLAPARESFLGEDDA